MKRVDWPTVALLVTLAAVWWLFTLTGGCDGLAPTEVAPAAQPQPTK
jgi:hypothetical protein